jgi:cytochrome P450 family 9
MVNTEIQDKLYEEIREMEEELDGKLITYEQIQGLKYLDQCLCESMRKWPAAPVSEIYFKMIKICFKLK